MLAGLSGFGTINMINDMINADIRYFCENSMIANAALKLKDTFAPRFVSTQSVLHSVKFWENYEVILAKFSSSCIYMLSLN